MEWKGYALQMRNNIIGGLIWRERKSEAFHTRNKRWDVREARKARGGIIE